MVKTLKNSFHRWCLVFLACGNICSLVSATAEANSLYWRRYSPNIIGPGPVFISPIGNIWNGGWWMSVDVGPTPLSICRILDDHDWAYGSYHDGRCHYYSRHLIRGNVVSIDFDLLGGDEFPNWRTLPTRPIRPLAGNEPLLGQMDTPVDPSQHPVSNSELSIICRIQQADGAFIGTLRDESCHAAWNEQSLISGDYDLVQSDED